ncbi:phosphoribosylanthranilate isomerase [Chloroflexota bacterium]
MTRVKICGIREKEHARAAVEAGADFIGLVFAYSPRQVTMVQAREITGAIKERSNAVEVVGVFVNMPAPVVNRTAQVCNLDRVQLSGDESWAYCQQIDQPLIKVLRINREQNPQQICDQLAAGAKILTGKSYLYHLDSRFEDRYGGTGITFDWSSARPAAEQFPLIIAGGLTAENVAQAIGIVAPWGVDTSSGVETHGVKDITKIKTFIEAVRRADERQS